MEVGDRGYKEANRDNEGNKGGKRDNEKNESKRIEREKERVRQGVCDRVEG